MIFLILTWKLVESRCKSLEESAILLLGRQHKTKRIRVYILTRMLSFIFPFFASDAHPSITFTTFPCHFLLSPIPEDTLSL